MKREYKATCPHCGTRVYLELYGNGYQEQGNCQKGGYNVVSDYCPSCDGFIVIVEHGTRFESSQYTDEAYDIDLSEVIFPKFSSGRILDNAIPTRYADNFREAEQVLNISPKASATISRYILQMVLHEELHITKRNLEEEIRELEALQMVSSKLVKMLQIFRKVANFGAHPKKNTNSGEIVEVEEGEAEIMLDLLDELFDCLFVKPKQQEEFLIDIKEKYGIEV